MSERGGIPLTVLISAANTNDHRVLQDVVDSVAPVKGPVGRPRRRPGKVHGDKGYDYPVCRTGLRRRGISRWRRFQTSTQFRHSCRTVRTQRSA